MKNYYSSNPTFYLGIDCIIFGFNEGEISLLLLKRNFEPAMGEWSLMGRICAKRRKRGRRCQTCTGWNPK